MCATDGMREGKPLGGYDEEDYISELELVKIIMEEVRALGATYFLIGGDLKIERELETVGQGLNSRDSTAWIGVPFMGRSARRWRMRGDV